MYCLRMGGWKEVGALALSVGYLGPKTGGERAVFQGGVSCSLDASMGSQKQRDRHPLNPAIYSLKKKADISKSSVVHHLPAEEVVGRRRRKKLRP